MVGRPVEWRAVQILTLASPEVNVQGRLAATPDQLSQFACISSAIDRAWKREGGQWTSLGSQIVVNEDMAANATFYGTEVRLAAMIKRAKQIAANDMRGATNRVKVGFEVTPAAPRPNIACFEIPSRRRAIGDNQFG